MTAISRRPASIGGLIDTSAMFALLDEDDVHHARSSRTLGSRDLGIRTAFAFDQDFADQGFELLGV